MFSDDVRDVIIHAAPTAWISPPRLEAKLAYQIRLYVLCCNGARGDALPDTITSHHSVDPIRPITFTTRQRRFFLNRTQL